MDGRNEVRGWFIADDPSDESSRGAVVEAGQLEADNSGGQVRQRRRCLLGHLGSLIARGHDEQQAEAGDVGDDEVRQRERRRICPMQILEHHHRRVRRRGCLERLDHGPEQCRPWPVDGLQQRVRPVTDESAQGLAPRPVGRGFAVMTSAPRGGAALAESEIAQVLGDARLADAGLAQHQHGPTTTDHGIVEEC